MLVAAAALLFCAQAAAQPLNKCQDAAGKGHHAASPAKCSG